ncbi:FAD-binding oxidoreductase [Legionella maioricensis]|uniref:FAD-binding oxidoreductase n=1 Tax=Legionella maioricensis TaxID=2896528 RepID=A0A9X2D3M9_9GAMM|nr:FAD-binding oxidoreductase [Legionella maioricensis]MCL9685638.1 FAD-binding oxidoreductase [Legionella maioricensis]MCL9689047.1 FAD-binding oxidoreductase [Legionella maioricensis]
MKMMLMSFYLIFSLMTQLSYADENQDSCPELTGEVMEQDNPDYNQARLVSNYYTSRDKYPEIIVYCQNTQDVQNAIRFALCRHLPIRVRSGGHNHEGFSTGTGVVLIDVSRMKAINIDKDKKIAAVQPGLNGGELYKALYANGLTQAGGTCSAVGISGLILTGGMGPLVRKVGMACDALIALEMVTAKGEIIQATKDNEHRDLFWASCGGGGGNFGVVTSLALHVYPSEQVTWFNIGWNWEQPVRQIITSWQEFFEKNDPRWYSHLDLWSKAFPADQYKKQPIKVLGIFWGTPEEAKKELAPLLQIGPPQSQTIELVTWDKAIELFEDSTSVYITPKPEYKSSGAYAMHKLPKDGVETIVSTLQNSTSPLLNVLFFTLGGAAKTAAPTDTAYFYRNADFFLVYSTQWLQENKDKVQIEELNSLRQKLIPFTQGDYIGNPDRNLPDYLTSYYGDNVRQLRCIKRKYDPDNIFNFEQSIPVAPKEWDCTT